MDYFEWQSAFETGIVKIDQQHQELFERINTFLLSLYSGEEQIELIKISNFLQGYVEFHFKTEEDLFKRYNYPNADEHIKQHNAFRIIQNKIFANVKAGKTPLSYAIEVGNQLNEWWTNHILGSDKKYVPYLKDEK
jgi:hemerythrin-like metal-binding protein